MDCISDSCDTPTLPPRYRLRQMTPVYLPTLMSWFDSAAALHRWSPTNTFPPDAELFAQQAKFEEVPSFALVDVRNSMVGFGQYAERAGCCHLSRLVIDPARRGQGLGSKLIELLAEQATKELGLSTLSLFVNRDNVDALRLYLRLGFDFAPFHDPVALHRAKAYYLRRPFPG